MESILQLEGISKSFPGVRALENARFDLAAGEVHALLGENGAGKSTMIKIVSGVYRPDAGTMRVNGEEVLFSSTHDAQRRGIATIYQELSLYPELTVAENIFMSHAPRNRLGMIRWGEVNRRAREVLESLRITDMDVTRKVGGMSVGNRQRVEIAKALSQNARILIMDEPTASLSEADVQRLFEIVRLLRERGVGIIYISHRMEEVFLLADRVTVLRDGHYVDTRQVKDVTEPQLIQMMVGRTIDQLFPKLDAPLGDPVLEVRNLSAGPLTRNVSFTVRSGEIVGMAGLVGSGRSETAQVIFGITRPEAGEIRIGGQPVRVHSPVDAMKLGIAYVPEDRGLQGLIRPMPVKENVSLASLGNLSRRSFIQFGREQRLAEDTVHKLSIRAYSTKQIVNKLSGGNQQKIVVGKWLAREPKLLIVDEPTRGIDVGAKAEIHRLMSELAQRGLGILMISSELPEVLGMSDRILVMREGRLVGEFKRGEADQEMIAGAMMSQQAAGVAS